MHAKRDLFHGLAVLGSIIVSLLTIMLLAIPPFAVLIAGAFVCISGLLSWRVKKSRELQEKLVSLRQELFQATKDSLFTIAVILAVTIFGLTINRLSGEFISQTIEDIFNVILVMVCLIAIVMATAPSMLERSPLVEITAGLALTVLAPIGFVMFMASVSIELASNFTENILGKNITHELFGEYDDDGEEITPGFFRAQVRRGVHQVISDPPKNPKTRPEIQLPELKPPEAIKIELEPRETAVIDPSSYSERTQERLRRLEELKDVDHEYGSVSVPTPPPRVTLSKVVPEPRSKPMGSQANGSRVMRRPGLEEEPEETDNDLMDTGEFERQYRRVRIVPLPIPVPIPVPRSPRSQRTRR